MRESSVEEEEEMSSCLIDGLPDAISLQCLARVPLGMHRVMRAVCKSWRSVLGSGELFRIRREAGLVEEWLYVTSFEPDRVWEAFDPTFDRWYTLPEFPTTVTHLSNFGTASVGGKLYVIGGGSDDVDLQTGEWDDCAFATPDVWCFDALQGRWETRSPMLTPRSQFACCAVDGKIIVAGGFSCFRRPLASGEVYDPETDTWKPIADMSLVFNSSCTGVVLGEKMHVMHKGESDVQVYDSALNAWTGIDSWWRECQGPMAVVRGELYTVASGNLYVIRDLQSPAICKPWPEYHHRIGFKVAAIGSDLYVVGGILGPRPENIAVEVLKDVDIWNVDDGFLERRGTSMSWCSGTVWGCAVVGL